MSKINYMVAQNNLNIGTQWLPLTKLQLHKNRCFGMISEVRNIKKSVEANVSLVAVLLS